MAITLENKQGLIAGDGSLPVKMAQYAKENGFEVVDVSAKIDAGEFENVKTEYERKFREKGMPIYALVAIKK